MHIAVIIQSISCYHYKLLVNVRRS